MDPSDQLIERITASKLFSRAPELCRLLRFFHKNKHRRVSTNEIEVYFGHEHGSEHARERTNKLKTQLQKYAKQAPPEEWLRCELLPAERKLGYQLQFKASSATAFFWSPHVDSGKEITVVCDPLLFFYDHLEGSMLRFVNTNVKKSNRTVALKKLERLHPGTNSHGRLVPAHFYLNAGAVMAAESLRNFFWDTAQRRASLFLGKDGLRTHLSKSSPIMVGTVRTNAETAKIFSSNAAKRFAYRMSAGQFSQVTVAKPESLEKEQLIPLGMEMDAVGKGVLKMRGNGMVETLTRENTLGIVTRMANPLRRGSPITFISSYSVLNVAQIAAALTDEEKLKTFFAQMDWTLEPPLPESFEMMFKVNLSPASFDDEEPGEAELLCWRPR